MRKKPYRFVAFSDFHAHNFNYGAQRVYYEPVSHGGPIKEGWYNSRLLDQLLALQETFEYALENNINLVTFCGDLFHKRQQVSVDVANSVYRALNFYSNERDITIVMIPGNHDYADRDGKVHSLSPLTHFEPGDHGQIIVLDTPTQTFMNGHVQLIPVPYTDDITVAREYTATAESHIVTSDEHPVFNVLMFHLGVQGAKVGGDYVLINDREPGLDDLRYKSYDLCLGGHYHQHQALAKNTYFVGALTQHNWGCVGGSRGFLDIKLSEDGHEVTRIETQAPKFWNIRPDDTEALAKVRDTDFVKVRIPEVNEETVAFYKAQLGEDFNIEFIADGEDDESIDVELDTLDNNEMLKTWVSLKNKDLDPERLLLLGSNLLTQAKGNTL